MTVLIDSNILIDIFTRDKQWFSWSSETLQALAETEFLCINPIIYSEVSICFNSIEELDTVLPNAIQRDNIPYDACFLAGKCFLKYRQQGGQKTSLLPDFLIGAHAAVKKWTLITRDKGRYATYFPSVTLITP